jgi:uncharacterized protein YdhG (YjbR/CyaY superfamily)
MPARPIDVDAYVADLSDEARTVTEKIRRLIHGAAPGITESMRYQMPCFQVDGEYLVYVGAWKHHIGMYPIPTLDGDLETDIAPYRAATDTVRFPYKRPIPYELIERLVADLIVRQTAHVGTIESSDQVDS